PARLYGRLGCLHVGLRSFFFQAEDGIRDATVTGVQTCALPISSISTQALIVARALLEVLPSLFVAVTVLKVQRTDSMDKMAEARSEERRVGKDGGGGGGAGELEKRSDREY